MPAEALDRLLRPRNTIANGAAPPRAISFALCPVRTARTVARSPEGSVPDTPLFVYPRALEVRAVVNVVDHGGVAFDIGMPAGPADIVEEDRLLDVLLQRLSNL